VTSWLTIATRWKWEEGRIVVVVVVVDRLRRLRGDAELTPKAALADGSDVAVTNRRSTAVHAL
jgi:hypothetical protein